MELAERETVEKVLARTKGNVAKAAAMLGILRTSLYRIMKRYGIASPSRARAINSWHSMHAGASLPDECLVSLYGYTTLAP